MINSHSVLNSFQIVVFVLYVKMNKKSVKLRMKKDSQDNLCKSHKSSL